MLSIQGTASDPEASLNRVEIWNGTTKLGNATLTTGTWSYTWTNVPTGIHQLSAIAYDGATDFTQTLALELKASMICGTGNFSDAALFGIGSGTAKPAPGLNVDKRWSVREVDGTLALYVRRLKAFDYSDSYCHLNVID